LGYTAFLVDFSDKPHPHLVSAHNDDLVVASTKLYKPLPRTDRRCARKAVILVVTTVGNIDFPHQHSSYWKILRAEANPGSQISRQERAQAIFFLIGCSTGFEASWTKPTYHSPSFEASATKLS